MPTCFVCKKDVTSGYVLCGDCAKEMKSGTIPPVLAGFAAWLGNELVQNDTVNFCSVCKDGKCEDPSVCRKGVAAWFREEAEHYLNASRSGILGRLKTVCPFPEVYEDLDMTDGPGRGNPRRKIGHIRADYDGYRWWSTVWGTHADLATAEIKAEVDSIYEALTAKDALHNLNALRRFCWSRPEAQHSPEVDDDFNFYLTGETCDFWVRLITREKEYNMYLSVYAKLDQGQEAQ